MIIENRLHWMLDVAFKEDAGTIKIDNVAVILSIIRQWTQYLEPIQEYNIFKTDNAKNHDKP